MNPCDGCLSRPPNKWPLAAAVWVLFSQACAIATISVLGAYMLSLALTKSGPVSDHTNQNLLTPKPIVGRSLIFSVTVDRHESCPGRIFDVYQRTVGANREQIIVPPRPLVTTEVKRTPNLKIVVPLPDELTAGKWHYISTLSSVCPTRDRDDTIIETDFEAVPPPPDDERTRR